jgi:predicted amidohydrolase YtcJ
MEHVMMLSDAQIEHIARLGVPCSLQPEFLMRLKPAYLRSLGPARTASLERCRSLLDAGVAVGLSSDKPVVAGDPWDGILTAENRPEGFDPSENVSREEALKGYTAGAADLCGDGATLGRLAPGEWADYQIYEDDPIRSKRPRLAEVRLARA